MRVSLPSVNIPRKLIRVMFSVQIRVSTGHDATMFCSRNFHSTIGEKNNVFTQAVLAPNMDLTRVSPKATGTEVCSCYGNFRALERTPNTLKKITKLHI